MKPLLLSSFLFIAIVATAQDSLHINDTDRVFTSVQVEAMFPGGVPAWGDFLSNNLKTKTPVKHHAPKGKYTVLVKFLVDTTGKISDVQVLQDPGYGTAEEVVRVMQKSPAWVPAVQNGRRVMYRQKQVITFVVE